MDGIPLTGKPALEAHNANGQQWALTSACRTDAARARRREGRSGNQAFRKRMFQTGARESWAREWPRSNIPLPNIPLSRERGSASALLASEFGARVSEVRSSAWALADRNMRDRNTGEISAVAPGDPSFSCPSFSAARYRSHLPVHRSVFRSAESVAPTEASRELSPNCSGHIDRGSDNAGQSRPRTGSD